MRITTCFLFRQLVLNLSAHRNHLGILENTDVWVSSPDWNNWSGIRPGFRLLKARVCSQDIHHWSTPFLSDSFESWKNPLSHTLFSPYCKTNSTLWYSCYCFDSIIPNSNFSMPLWFLTIDIQRNAWGHQICLKEKNASAFFHLHGTEGSQKIDMSITLWWWFHSITCLQTKIVYIKYLQFSIPIILKAIFKKCISAYAPREFSRIIYFMPISKKKWL